MYDHRRGCFPNECLRRLVDSAMNCSCGLVQERGANNPLKFILELIKRRLLQFGGFGELLSGARSLKSQAHEAIHERSSSAAPGVGLWSWP